MISSEHGVAKFDLETSQVDAVVKHVVWAVERAPWPFKNNPVEECEIWGIEELRGKQKILTKIDRIGDLLELAGAPKEEN